METTPLFKKLNHKPQQAICILNSPDSFATELEAIRQYASVQTSLEACESLDFVLTFVISPTDVEAVMPIIDQKLQGDGIVWFAFPKGTSKRYKATISRDKGWDALGRLGYEPVRSVAIDADWTVLRFRRVAYIKTMTRNPEMVLSADGKAKVQKQADK